MLELTGRDLEEVNLYERTSTHTSCVLPSGSYRTGSASPVLLRGGDKIPTVETTISDSDVIKRSQG